jgi:hypothetical protein
MFKVLDHSLQNAGGPNLQIGKVEDLSRNVHKYVYNGVDPILEAAVLLRPKVLAHLSSSGTLSSFFFFFFFWFSTTSRARRDCFRPAAARELHRRQESRRQPSSAALPLLRFPSPPPPPFNVDNKLLRRRRHSSGDLPGVNGEFWLLVQVLHRDDTSPATAATGDGEPHGDGDLI